jgi:hypothetical protein
MQQLACSGPYALYVAAGEDEPLLCVGVGDMLSLCHKAAHKQAFRNQLNSSFLLAVMQFVSFGYVSRILVWQRYRSLSKTVVGRRTNHTVVSDESHKYKREYKYTFKYNGE